MRKRIVVESVLLSWFMIIGYFIWQAFRGYDTANTYVPEILGEYEVHQVLQSSTDIGEAHRYESWPFVLAALIGLSLVYCILRIGINALRKNRGA